MLIEDDILGAADKWREEGKALRKQLMAERVKLTVRLAQIDQRLKTLPDVEDDGSDRDVPHGLEVIAPEPVAAGLRVTANDTVPDIVRAILGVSSVDMTATRIINIAKRINPDINPREIHSALYRMTKRGEIQPHGEPGFRTYARKAS